MDSSDYSIVLSQRDMVNGQQKARATPRKASLRHPGGAGNASTLAYKILIVQPDLPADQRAEFGRIRNRPPSIGRGTREHGKAGQKQHKQHEPEALAELLNLGDKLADRAIFAQTPVVAGRLMHDIGGGNEQRKYHHGADDRDDDVFAVAQAGTTSVHHDPSPPFPVSPIILLIQIWIVNMKTSFKLKKNCEHTVTREF
jgi:hypothetical protein